MSGHLRGLALGVVLVVVGCSLVPPPPVPARVDEIPGHGFVFEDAGMGDSPLIGRDAARAAAETALVGVWDTELEEPVLARLGPVQPALQGIDPPEHRLVWIVLSPDRGRDVIVVVSGSSGEVLGWVMVNS